MMKWLKIVLLTALLLPAMVYAAELLSEEFSGGTTSGIPYGLTYEAMPTGQGARFTRLTQSRVQYPYSAGMARSGTIEIRLKIDSAYRYSNYSLLANESCALVFTTDISGGDVTYPGSA